MKGILSYLQSYPNVDVCILAAKHTIFIFLNEIFQGYFENHLRKIKKIVRET